MNKTEFNPLSYKEGQGIIAAIEDDEKLIKPIKVDRISVDGVSESLESEISEKPVSKKTESQKTEGSSSPKLKQKKKWKDQIQLRMWMFPILKKSLN